MKDLWIRFQLIRGYFQMVRNPQNTELIFKALELVAQLKDQGPLEEVLKGLYSHPEFKAMVDEGYMPRKPDLEELGKMPEGSFGREVFNHMTKNKIDFDLFPEEVPDGAIKYVNQRMYLDHDLWHVLLSYNTDVSDELALQGFNVAQLRSPFSAMIISGGLLHLLKKNPLTAADTLGLVARGYQRGKQAKFLLGIKLHEMFERPINEVRMAAGV